MLFAPPYVRLLQAGSTVSTIAYLPECPAKLPGHHIPVDNLLYYR